MSDAAERINHPISSAELERRWAAVRKTMAERRIDALLMQANNDFMGGYVKYFTDVPATNGYSVTVVFPRDERMTVIAMGPEGLVRDLPPNGDPLRRGVARFMGTPSFASAVYTAENDARLAEKALAGYGSGTIGLLGTAAMSFSLVDYLKRALPKATFVDASDLVDRVKAVKSAEEIAFMRRVAAMQDAAMQAVFSAIRPGMRDLEVAAVAERFGRSHGSEQGLFLCASGPVGTAAAFGNRHVQNRVIRAGDQFTLLIENSGAGGFYTEIGRTCVLGRASEEMHEEFAFVVEAQKFTTSLLKPGASCREIWNTYNAYLREHGKPEEQRLHCHSQGYDMVERPLVRYDETMTIGRDMVVSCHPTYVTARTYSWVCDNFLIGAHCVTERLHQLPQKIFELG
jgi:Xaa-Pro aminopeptidase